MKIVTFRIEPGLWKRAKARAKLTGRSLSGLIRYLLRKELGYKK